MRSTLLAIVSLVTLLLSSPAANAATACYSAAESRADAALRYQARLRVAGLMCKSASGNSLFPTYQLFTANNAGLIADYAKSLERHYGAEGFHTYETETQNRESLVAAEAGVPRFCKQHAAELQSAVLASPAEIQRDVAAFAALNPSPVSSCK